MSINSSNDSLHPYVSSVNMNLLLNVDCHITGTSSFISLSFSIMITILLLPLCIFILYCGLQQWWQKRSTSSATTISHIDSFTYHMAIMELIAISGYILICDSYYHKDSDILVKAFFLTTFSWYGEIFFHVLTCVERYLAVIHPITYLNLRNVRGIRIRNISIVCVWLLSFVGMSLVSLETFTIILICCLMILALIAVSFCSFCVLYSLSRPGPGDQSGGRKKVDHTKLKAFYIIVAILVVLVLRFGWGLVWSVLYLLGRQHECVIMTCGLWFNLPSSLALPLLFLQRTGKFDCCNIVQGE